MNARCLIVQPIHADGLAVLRAAGVDAVPASAPDMATVTREIVGCPDHPLLALPNAVLTPHVGASSDAAGRRTAVQVAEQVIAVVRGRRPEHLVNPEVWARRRS